MSTMVERDRRWAVVGDDAGYLSSGPSAPRGAGVLAVLGLLSIAVAVCAVLAGAPAAVPTTQAPVSLATAIDVPTFRSHEPDALLPNPSSDLGGDEPHLARNDNEATLEMAVTYLPRAGQSRDGFRVDEAPPALCPVA